MQEHDRSGSSLQFMSVVESEVRDVVEGASFTSQRVLMVPLDKVKRLRGRSTMAIPPWTNLMEWYIESEKLQVFKSRFQDRQTF